MKIFCIFFVADPGFEPGQSNYCLGVMSPTFYHYTNPQCYWMREWDSNSRGPAYETGLEPLQSTPQYITICLFQG